MSCRDAQHLACSGFSSTAIACVCSCHVGWSTACRWGGHEWCTREDCRCPCSHTAVALAEKAMAAA